MNQVHSLLPDISWPSDRKEQLRRLQELAVRLYFSDSLQRAINTDRDGTLARLGISASNSRYVPDTATSDFQAECWGRRFMVAKEIAARFPRYFSKALAAKSSPADIAHSPVFRQFIESEHFLRPEFSFEHPYGIGRGYENVSKFFAWATSGIEEFNLHNPEVQNALHLDFSIHLMALAKHSVESAFVQLVNGITFIDHSDPLYSILVINGKVIRSQLSPTQKRKLFNLSQVSL